MASLRRKFSFQLIYALSQAIFPLITYPFLTRTIGAAGLGTVGYVDYVSGLIITVVSFGIPFYGVREVAKAQNLEGRKEGIFQQLFTIQLVASFFGVFFFIGIIKANQHQNLPLFLILLGCINILLPPFIAEWYMQGIEAFQFTTIRNIALRILGLAAILLFISAQNDYVIYFLIIVLVQFAVAFTNMTKIGFKNIRIKTTGLRKHLHPLWHFFLTTSIISIYVFFDVIILGWFVSDEVVGYYTLAIRLVKLSLLLILSMNIILFPRISHLLATKNVESIQSLLQKAFSFILLLTLPIAAGFFFLAPQIIFIIGGNAFSASITLVRILCFLPLIIGLSNLFVYQVLVPYGMEKKLLKSVIVTCVCSLVFHVTLVSFFKVTGTAVATLLTELCMALLTGYYATKTIDFSFPVKIIWQSLFALLPMIMLILLCRKQFDNPFAVLFLSGVPGIGLYTLIQVSVFRNVFLKEALNNLRWRRNLSVSNG